MSVADRLGPEPELEPDILPAREPRAGRSGPSPWLAFAGKRLLGLLGTVVVLVLVTFFMVRLIPGDPAVAVAGPDASQAQIKEIRAQLGLDASLPAQFRDYVSGLLHGDLGQSFSQSQPVTDVLSARLPYTVGIALPAMLLVLLVAVPLGMAVGVLTRGGRNRWLDRLFGFGSGLVSAVPQYVMATFLVLIFAVTLAVLPPAYSRSSPGESYVLPILGLAIGPICVVARVVRRETAVVLEHDYFRTARGWRLPAWRLYGRYLLPSLLTSTLTMSGLILTSMLGSAIVVETVFGWPGLGLGIVQAILSKDYPVIQGIILVLGLIAALITLLVDILLGLIDPRTLGASHD
jgi:peptide/nickel transport system permease protein